MKIAVDARMITRSGIGTCIREWIPRVKYSIVLGKEEDLRDYKNSFESLVPFDCGIYGYKEQLKFPYRKLKKQKPDVLHIPHCNVPLFYRGKMIVTIHDLTHLIYPQFLPFRAVLWYFKFIFRFATWRANRILTDSESTKRDIIRFFHTPEEKITVVPLGVGSEFVKKSAADLEYLYEKFSIPRNKKLLIYVGNLLPHKNLSTLQEALAQMPARENCRLILVGKAFDGRTRANREAELGISNLTIHAGVVNQEDLANLYNLADLFVLPSLYEGFGLPVLEAMACGTPVACSNTSSLPEVGGNFAHYFNPTNATEMAAVIQSALNCKAEESEKLIAHAQEFNWEKSSQKIIEIAKQVAEEA
ncbi:MAG: glycosyltransferase family 1 protein [Hallerella porci]|uniref:Glycosyltransferase involved in cell wall biosynthesis n=1 Tax=Hallerella porci TaxID=1945871 RepID=A0ABX5LI79_9BACT|nr:MULTISPECIES: glycosyltransferase family 1 protein [Hallerella]MCI5601364.1 glycosyltransferase family 4 protein [Hallerella sp.]MDY3922175.1 glycosyltransferase family 1 protein [Hallerella porci]PWK88463.1 glycosyltransferase involved in cell wall biosynthesis [Hallerella porci]